MTKDLGERIKTWYESYGVCPPWSSVVGFIVRESKRVRSQAIKEVIGIVEKLPKYMENEQPIGESGRFIRTQDLKSKLKSLI